MNDLMKSATVAVLLGAAMLCPRTSSAMTIEMFDAMAVEDQRDYLKLLVNRAQEVLIAQDRQDLAAAIGEMFRTRRGERQSPGEAEFQKRLTIGRDYVVQEQVKAMNIKIVGGEVEGALIGTLQKNGIPMSHALFKALTQAWSAKPFWPKRPLRTASVS